MAVPVSEFIPYVLPYAVGCPVPLAQRHVLHACIEFARRSLVLEEIEQLNSVATKQDYDLGVPAGCVVTRIKDVMYNGLPLDPTSREMIRYAPALVGANSGTAELKSGPPQKFFQKAIGEATVSLYPAPDNSITGGLVVTYWYEPARNAATVPDVLYNLYLDDIVNGALSRVLATPNQPFSDKKESLDRGSLFSAGIRNAGITARTGQVAVSSRVQRRNFVV